MASKPCELPKIVVEFCADIDVEAVSSLAMSRQHPSRITRHSKSSKTDKYGSVDPQYCTLLATVTTDNCTIIPKLVKENGVQIDELNAQGFSALHEAAFEGKLTCVETLINCGASVNIKDLDSWTPLHAAVLGGNLRCVSFLARNGADLWAETVENQLPFHIAVERRDDNMIALLAQEMTNQSFKATLAS